MKEIVFTNFLPILLVIVFSGSHLESATVSERGREPETFNVGSEDPEMNQAIKRARDSVQSFLKQLVAPKQNQSHFSVKKPFPFGKDGENEHIWVNSLRYDGTRLHGKISNTPVDLKNLKLGDLVSFLPSEIRIG